MKNTLALIGLTFILPFAHAQDEIKSKFSLGFYLEGNRTFLQAKDIQAKDLEFNPSFGFGLGIATEYTLSNSFALHAKAGLSFGNSSIDYTKNDLVLQKYAVYPQNLDFRLHGKYYFGKNESQPYVLFGPSGLIALNNHVKTADQFPNQNGFAVDFGLGYNKVLSVFRFAPEIRYSYGLNNINSSPMLSSLYVHRLTLTFNFMD